LKALGLTDKNIRDAYDNATFKPEKNRAPGTARTTYSHKKGTKSSTVRTRSGVAEFGPGSYGFLIHEMSHAAAKLNDRQIYNRLNQAGASIQLVMKTQTVKGKGGKTSQKQTPDYSQSVSDFFNDNCN
jgi:hypothetical protein